MATFRAHYTKAIKSEAVFEATPDTSSTYVVGDFIYFDTSTQTMKKCGADPSLIAAVSEVNSTDADDLTENGKVPYRALQTTDVLAMCSTSTPTAANVGVAYGIVNTGGVWKVDFTDTSNTRVFVLDFDSGTETVYVRPMAANLQFDGIAS